MHSTDRSSDVVILGQILLLPNEIEFQPLEKLIASEGRDAHEEKDTFFLCGIVLDFWKSCKVLQLPARGSHNELFFFLSIPLLRQKGLRTLFPGPPQALP